MQNFNYNIATRIHFGKGTVSQYLKDEVLRYGTKVLFVYDDIPVKASGLYDEVVKSLNDGGIEFVEFSGIEPNPKHTTINKGISLLRETGGQVIIAAGGGSTIDTGKAIGFGYYGDEDVWDFYSGKKQVTKTLPVICIPTLAAAGAEVSWSAVVSNLDVKRKIGLRNPINRPAVAIADPTYTFSVPAFHTSCGVIDIMSHTLETYFSSTMAMQDSISEGIQLASIHAGRKVKDNPNDYDARADLMWAAMLSIMQISSFGRYNSATIIHTLEHMLSAHIDAVIHGAGIGIMSLAFYKYALNDATAPKFATWGRKVWGVPADLNEYEAAREAIARYEAFIEEMGLPTRLSQMKVDRNSDKYITLEDVMPVVEDLALTSDGSKWYAPVKTKEDYLAIFKLAL
ncbi:MAG: iron-containing alcohol dehydrogenase [Erysipelotrichaceae bacterium]|nr:iron-containing alcohol dehydrogenase [Erysipelotrichaceae bacterium]